MIGSPVKKLIIVIDDKTNKYGELLSALIMQKDDKKDADGNIIEDGIIGIKDGSLETVLWDTKTYTDNLPQLGSANKILFIGKNSTTDPIMSNISFNNQFAKYGVCFGSLGNKAVIYADKKLLSGDKNAYDEFIEAYTNFLSDINTDFTLSQSVEKVGEENTFFTKRKKALTGAVSNVLNKSIDGINKGVKGVQSFSEKHLDKNRALPEETEQSQEEKACIPYVSPKVADNAAALFTWPVAVADSISLTLSKVKSGKELMDQLYRCAVITFYIEHLAGFMG